MHPEQVYRNATADSEQNAMLQARTRLSSCGTKIDDAVTLLYNKLNDQEKNGIAASCAIAPPPDGITTSDNQPPASGDQPPTITQANTQAKALDIGKFFGPSGTKDNRKVLSTALNNANVNGLACRRQCQAALFLGKPDLGPSGCEAAWEELKTNANYVEDAGTEAWFTNRYNKLKGSHLKGLTPAGLTFDDWENGRNMGLLKQNCP